MSDTGRESFTNKTKAAVKPDSEKSNTQHFQDKFKGNADSAASSVQPQSEKSTTQKMGDKFSSNSNNSNDQSFTDKAKNALGFGDKH